MRTAVEDDLEHPGPLAASTRRAKGQRFLGE